ncbi:uncharacterized protein [Nerophis lumbriciformis]|uniref:uncharacterized protein n=1 Tax=Nerophis lumbriciformis TaxID=546530 RepID=UPI003BA90C69
MGNGQTERFNRTLGSMLRSLPLAAKQHWAQQIQTLTFAYNATVHETTGYAPFYLMFGRVPRLPVDMVFKQVLKDTSVVDYNTYASKLMTSLHEAANIAQQHTRKEQQHQADGYNKKIRGTCLNVGDRVLLANKAERGKRKLADKWEPSIYTVIDRNPQNHIYKVQDESGKTKVVHRNLILDVSFLPIPEQTSAEPVPGTSDEISEFRPQPLDTSSDVADENPEDHICSWVCKSSDADCESSGEDRESEEEDETTCSPIRDSDRMSLGSSEADPAGSGSIGQREEILPPRDLPGSSLIPKSPLTNEQNDPLTSLPDISDTRLCDIMPTTVNDSQAPTQDSGHERHVVRTRTGRVVKAVNRLIENMVQKPLPKGIQRFRRKSQSLMTLF